MTEAYQRAVQVTIGTTDLSRLQVEFAISAQLAAEPDTCDLRIYNLARATRGVIEQAPKHTRVSVQAGYQGQTSELFLGGLLRATTAREGPDVVTTVEANAGGAFRQRARRLDRGYAPGTRLSTVINDAIAATGVGRGNIDDLLTSATLDGAGSVFEHGFAASGPAWDTLTALLQSSGFELTVQSDQLRVVRKRQALPNRAVRLNKTTGLIGVPSIDGGGTMACQSLLVPGLYPGRLVQVESAFVNGFFRIQSASYQGSLFGQEFSANLEGRVVG